MVDQAAKDRILWLAIKWQQKNSWILTYRCAKESQENHEHAARDRATLRRLKNDDRLPGYWEMLQQQITHHATLADAQHKLAIEANGEFLQLENLIREHAPTLLELVPQPDFFDTPETNLSPLIRDLKKLEGQVRERLNLDAPATSSEPTTKGVTLRDAALLLNDGDGELATETTKRWRNTRNPKLPPSIGKCPKQSQSDLFLLAQLLDFLKIVEPGGITSDFIRNLSAKLRPPRNNPTQTDCKPTAPTAKSQRPKSQKHRKS